MHTKTFKGYRMHYNSDLSDMVTVRNDENGQTFEFPGELMVMVLNEGHRDAMLDDIYRVAATTRSEVLAIRKKLGVVVLT